MQKVISVDVTKCTGCRTCETVCTVKKLGMVNPTLARVHVMRFDAVTVDVPVFCQQCTSAPCMSVCPVKAISRDEDIGVVRLDEERCIGCKMCVAICPFGVAGFNPVTRKAFKCDQCDGDPTCVKFCETKAIQYVDALVMNLRKSRDTAQKIANLVASTREPGLGVTQMVEVKGL